MAIGIVLGNTVEAVGPALQKGEFVGVSIPIGTFLFLLPISTWRGVSLSLRLGGAGELGLLGIMSRGGPRFRGRGC